MITKKLFRSFYVEERVSEIKTVVVDEGSLYRNIAWMEGMQYHQVIATNEVQLPFLLEAIKNGAKLTAIRLQEAHMTERQDFEQNPQKSLLVRFMGMKKNENQIEEAYQRLRAEQEVRREEQELRQQWIDSRLSDLNESPGKLVRLYEELEYIPVSEVALEWQGEAFSLSSNGRFQFSAPSEYMNQLEGMLIRSTLDFFNPTCDAFPVNRL